MGKFDPPLSEGWGWGIVIGFGFAISILTFLLTKLDSFESKKKRTAEVLFSAGRNNTSGMVSMLSRI